MYGISGPEEDVEIVNLRVRSIMPRQRLVGKGFGVSGVGVEPARRGTRPAYFESLGGFIEASIYDRQLLNPGDRLDGPAIVEQLDSTTVVAPGWTGQVDDFGNIVVEKV